MGSTPTSRTVETLDRLVRNVADASPGMRALALAELYEHVAHELRHGRATAANIRAATSAHGAWCEAKVLWVDGFFVVLEAGKDRR